MKTSFEIIDGLLRHNIRLDFKELFKLLCAENRDFVLFYYVVCPFKRLRNEFNRERMILFLQRLCEYTLSGEDFCVYATENFAGFNLQEMFCRENFNLLMRRYFKEKRDVIPTDYAGVVNELVDEGFLKLLKINQEKFKGCLRQPLTLDEQRLIFGAKFA